MWEVNGIKGHGECPDIAGTFHGPLLLLGTARCLWDDLSRVQGDPDYMSVNIAGCFTYKKITHWVSKHPNHLPHYIDLYQEFHFPINTENQDWNFFSYLFRPKIYAHAPAQSEFNWEFDLPTEGSSSMFGVLVGLALGYNPVILVGIPLDGTGCFYDPPWVNPINYCDYRPYWEAMVGVFQGRVKSLSGFTRDLLGEP